MTVLILWGKADCEPASQGEGKDISLPMSEPELSEQDYPNKYLCKKYHDTGKTRSTLPEINLK